MTFTSAAGSHTGRGRRINQDAGYAGARLLAVADGDGVGGEIAAAFIIDALRGCDTEMAAVDPLVAEVRDAVGRARERIRSLTSRRPELAGMGTAFTALMCTGDELVLVGLGTTQAQLLRESGLYRVTHDDEPLCVHGMSGEDLSRMRRAVPVLDAGTDPEPSITLRKIRTGDRYLLCCAALAAASDTVERYEVLVTEPDPVAAVARLLDLAERKGRRQEDLTCVVADVTDTPGVNPPMVVAAGASLPGT